MSGLSARPKQLPPKLFYDAEGSRLFEEITATPEYYPTRTEYGILQQYASEIIGAAGSNLSLIELGAGSASKTRTLIAALLRRQLRLEFLPVDVSPAALEAAVRSLNGDFPRLHVHPIVADYSFGVPQLRALPGRKLVLFIGSTIGNFEPEEARDFLQHVRGSLRPGDVLLLGFDLVKDAQVLHEAYNDRAGVTAEFDKNVLARINRELGGNFCLETFEHVAFWNPAMSRIEMHLESRNDQVVYVRDLDENFHFHRGERIHTENSYKFCDESISGLLRESGLRLETSWTDPNHWFRVVLARI
ncbi:MAG TPA: L-histidine N(alpha)-methyltransferase [Candidatus Angelobacter sp.]